MSRIMVIDDDHDILRYCDTVLSAQGHEVVLRSDAQLAIDTLKNHAVDLLIVDVVMPLMSGYDFLKEIRRQKLSQAPVLMLTRKNTPKDVTLALELGATDYMVKPFDRDVFSSKIESILGSTKTSPEVKFAAGSTASKAILSVPAMVVGITEMGLTLRTLNYVERNVRIGIDSQVFQEIGIVCPALRTVSCRPIEGDSEYQYEVFVSFVGLDEAAMKKIRRWISGRAISMRKVS
ncbi:MAG: response regulator [Bdellovibrionota bacterium]